MNFFELITPIRIYILFTFIMVAINHDKSKKVHVVLFYLLLLSVANESITAILKYKGIPRFLINSVFIIIHHIIWFLILYLISSIKKPLLLALMLFFAGFTVYNFFFLNGIKEFNFYTFVIGALLYLVLFIHNSFSELKAENLNYFLSNNFILMLSPVLFFIGFSLLFAFSDKNIHKIFLFERITLYNLISYFVNIVYYSLVNIYIYRETKMGHVK